MNKSSQFLLYVGINAVANFAYAMMLPFYPPLAALHGVSDSLIGLIICTYPIGAFICTFFLGSNMSFNKKKYVILCLKVHTSWINFDSHKLNRFRST